MKSKTSQWIMWAATMILFLGLTLSGHFDWLAVALVASSLLWYVLVRARQLQMKIMQPTKGTRSWTP